MGGTAVFFCTRVTDSRGDVCVEYGKLTTIIVIFVLGLILTGTVYHVVSGIISRVMHYLWMFSKASKPVNDRVIRMPKDREVTDKKTDRG
jgi:hypothetical protein